MDLLSNLALGFGTALSPSVLLFCFVGVTVGMFVGILPGIGPIAAISMALPITYYLEPTSALIMVAGIFYGAQYGGSITSILMNLPGTASSAVVCLDGYQMTKQGRAGVALLLTTVCSFLGGTFAILLVMGFAPALARFALTFTSAEYFSVMLLALVAASTVSYGAPLKGLAMVVVGLILGLVGTDFTSGQFRFTFGLIDLADGVNLVAVAMGLFGVAEIFSRAGSPPIKVEPASITMRSMIPRRDDVRRLWSPTLRGAILGSIVGVLPGTGPTIAAFVAYASEKRFAKDPSRFGKGAVEGVVAPESANNASVQAAFIPTLSLGIPGDAVMAVILGAMMIHGILPGPNFITTQPAMFWGLIASFWIGNVILLFLNIPLIGIWVKMLAIPYRILYLAILFFICVGAYSVTNSVFAIYVTLFFGVVGYVMNLFNYPAAPLLLGLVLGPMVEDNFKRALMVARGDFMVFLQRPISAVLLFVTLLILVVSLRPVIVAPWKWWTRRRVGNRPARGNDQPSPPA